MKKKIHFRMCGIALIATLMTAVLVTFSFYRLTTERAWENLTDVARMISMQYSEKTDISKICRGLNSHYRVTLIDTDGKVQYDSRADAATMENHKNREEVKGAMKDGEAKAIRQSSTLGMNTYYFAERLSSGKVIRISADTDSIMTTFMSVLPYVVVICIGAILVCLLVSTRLTKGLLKPVEELGNGKLDTPYKELEPFARSIKERQEMERMKQEFTANVSHELKTPLTSISGYAELIESGIAKPEDVHDFATKIHTEAGRLIVLIGDIMQLSELEEPGSVCEFEPVLLQDLIQETILSLEIPAKKRNVHVSYAGEEKTILGDKRLLSEIIYNLCDNAIRYNKENGSVTVRVWEEQDNTVLSVKDTGIGIPEKKQEYIFRRFYRVDKSRSKETGGTGLGLAIVKHIAELHDADIRLKSEENQGTEIQICFPNKSKMIRGEKK